MGSTLKSYNITVRLRADQREGKKCFKCHGYRHFQANYPNRRTLSIREVDEIQAIEEEESEGEYEEDDSTLVIQDVGELLVIRRALHAK